jgi:hypothetical protein
VLPNVIDRLQPPGKWIVAAEYDLANADLRREMSQRFRRGTPFNPREQLAQARERQGFEMPASSALPNPSGSDI